jgi:tetratricopeptide (TPR) repeat protein
MNRFGIALLIAAPALLFAARAEDVRVSLGAVALPVSGEGLPDINPPFDAFASLRLNYPYTLRENVSPRSQVRHLRAVLLENQYLKCSILPDIGGHIYSCTDKINGREMFYANPSLKKANIGYRGAWSAFGVEFNFPVSHNWVSMSPVDFAFRTNDDGSASVTLANIDRPYGMQWRVELRLRPGSTVLEQHVTLYNRSDVRHRYYWWTNAGVEVWDDTEICYPMRYSASHGFTFVDTWPVNQAGRDLSVIANHVDGPVSQFVHGSREPFMGLYHQHTRSGVVHFAEYAELPAKKIWTWGVDADGLDWRDALSDNHSAYAEVQAGLFRNQETYGFLPPQKGVRFTEYWMPVREIGGITRANLHGVLHLARKDGALTAALNVNHEIRDARIRITAGSKVLFESRGTLTPERGFSQSIAGAPAAKCTFELSDGAGAALLVHTEEQYDWTPAAEIRTGPQAGVDRQTDPLELGADQEANGRLLSAWSTYEQALRGAPDDFELNRAAGRLAVGLLRYEDAVRLLSKAQYRMSNDPETQYYLGVARAALGENREARSEWEGAARQPQFREAGLFELARLTAREGDRTGALNLLNGALVGNREMVRAGGMEVALLRVQGKVAEARERLGEWLREDPTSAFLRNEQVLLGGPGDDLWRHLAADPERVIGTAEDYMDIGMWADALSLLSRRYPAIDPAEAEPGAVLPQEYPLVAYYRGYCREKLGQSGKLDFDEASHLPARYVFPSRASSLAVLRSTLAGNPQDGMAHGLLGDLLMSEGRVDAALAEWNSARLSNPGLPALHRNIARTLLAVKHDYGQAAEVYREGIRYDAENRELYTGLNVAASLLGRPAGERADTLLAYPKTGALTTPMVFDLALTLAEAGRLEEADRVFQGRSFAREEGAVNVRQAYIEVQLRKALTLARSGRRNEALAVTGKLGQAVDGLAFTREGMSAFQKGDRYEYLVGSIESLCGDTASARRHWQTAAAGHGGFAVLAAWKLGLADWRSRAEADVARATEPSNPQSRLLAERGLLLRALGREEQAKAALRESLLAPDRQFSHYIARTALLSGPSDDN